MNETFENWLNQRGRLPGILAGGICLADQTCLASSATENFLADRIRDDLRQVAEFTRGLSYFRLQANRLVWTFENAYLHWVVREDGVGLGLFTATGADACDPGILERLIQEFLEL